MPVGSAQQMEGRAACFHVFEISIHPAFAVPARTVYRHYHYYREPLWLELLWKRGSVRTKRLVSSILNVIHRDLKGRLGNRARTTATSWPIFNQHKGNNRGHRDSSHSITIVLEKREGGIFVLLYRAACCFLFPSAVDSPFDVSTPLFTCVSGFRLPFFRGSLRLYTVLPSYYMTMLKPPPPFPIRYSYEVAAYVVVSEITFGRLKGVVMFFFSRDRGLLMHASCLMTPSLRSQLPTIRFFLCYFSLLIATTTKWKNGSCCFPVHSSKKRERDTGR